MSPPTGKQAKEHDDKQEDVRNEGDNYGNFGSLDVERHARASGDYPRITKLLEG